MTRAMIRKANPILILTKRFEQVCRGKLPIEENGAVVDVKSPAHADQQNLQAAYSVATGRGKDMEMERDGGKNQREDEGRRGQNAPSSTKHSKIIENNGENDVNCKIILNIFFSLEVQMSYTHCLTNNSVLSKEINFLCFVGVGLKGCVIYIKKKRKNKEYWRKEKKQKRELKLASFKLISVQRNHGQQLIPC